MSGGTLRGGGVGGGKKRTRVPDARPSLPRTKPKKTKAKAGKKKKPKAKKA